MTRTAWIALAIVALFLTTGCEGGESRSTSQSTSHDPSPPPVEETVSPPSTAGAVVALENLIEAAFGFEAETVCGLQTEGYSAAIIKSMADQGFIDQSATCEDAALMLSYLTAGFHGDSYALDAVTVRDRSVDGTKVVLRTDYTGGPHNEFEVSYIDGRWLVSGDAETKGTMTPLVGSPSG